MTNVELYQEVLKRLVADLTPPDHIPLLAHYCSTASLEGIIKNKQLWLSNPLFMNDLEEVRFGVLKGTSIARESQELKDALKTGTREQMFFDALSDHFDMYSGEHVFDLYIACFSEHSIDDEDGRLSMWRAYAASGDGAALIFDLNSVVRRDGSYNGLLLDKVGYGTKEEREQWLRDKVIQTARIIDEITVPDEYLGMVAAALFERIKLMAVFSKHSGFLEENEWRLVYMAERDFQNKYESCLNYAVTARGVEPKLRLPIHGAVPWHTEAFDFASILQKVILGPSVSSQLARMSTARMMKILGMPSLIDKLQSSSIPLRPKAI